jgi:hypothetical protein
MAGKLWLLCAPYSVMEFVGFLPHRPGFHSKTVEAIFVVVSLRLLQFVSQLSFQLCSVFVFFFIYHRCYKIPIGGLKQESRGPFEARLFVLCAFHLCCYSHIISCSLIQTNSSTLKAFKLIGPMSS